MDEYNFKVSVWIVIFCLYIAMASYLYFVRIPNIQTRTSREIERDRQRTLLNNLPPIPENLSLEEFDYLSLDEELFRLENSLEQLSQNIRVRERSTTV